MTALDTIRCSVHHCPTHCNRAMVLMWREQWRDERAGQLTSLASMPKQDAECICNSIHSMVRGEYAYPNATTLLLPPSSYLPPQGHIGFAPEVKRGV